MSDFKAKMHPIRFRLGLCPRPRWGSLQRSPDPLAGFKGPTSKGRGGEGRGGERKGEGREGRKRGGRGPISSAGPGPPKHVKTALPLLQLFPNTESFLACGCNREHRKTVFKLFASSFTKSTSAKELVFLLLSPKVADEFR